jgi:serine phosphatase RsbU (regulator of sigma subunit)
VGGGSIESADSGGSLERSVDERSPLVPDLETANRQLEGLLGIVSSALGGTDPDAVFANVLSSLREVMQADAALLFLHDSRGWLLTHRSGYETLNENEFRLADGEGFVSEVALAGRPIWTRDVRSIKGFVAIHDELGMRSVLGVPLMLHGELYGVLECAWGTDRLVSESELVMLQVAADRIMSAVAGARQFQQTARSRELESALAAIASDLNVSHELDETIPRALSATADVLGCDVAAFGRYDGVGTFKVMYAIGCEVRDVALQRAHGMRSPVDAALPVVRVDRTSPASEWLAREFGVKEAVVVPVRVRGEWFGAILLGRAQESDRFDELTDDFARRLSNALSLAYANARDFEMEHRIAETLQESLLVVDPDVRGVDFGHVYRSSTTAARVGGDFYDVFEVTGGRVAVLVGDVSGKGLDAAVLTTLVKHTVRALAHHSGSVSDVVSKANAVLVSSARMREFASIVLFLLDPRTGEATYCQAGHPPAVVRRRDGSTEVLWSASPVIGAFADLAFEEGTLRIGPGDVVVAYTDGVTDVRSADGHFFGEDGLVRWLDAVGDVDVESLPSQLLGAVESHGDGHFKDDIAIVAFSVDPIVYAGGAPQ